MSEVARVEAANSAFYAAFESGDLDAMRALWLERADTVCVHPGTTSLRGTSAIARSWALIMANTPYIQFFLTDVEVSVHGEVATVTCTENVLTGNDNPDVFGGGSAVATNIFLRVPDSGGEDRWRLWVHHASPVLSGDNDE